MNEPDDHLAVRAHRQRGTFTREQARDSGLSDGARRHRVRAGFLDQVGVRTFRSPLSPASAIDDLQALILDVGDPVWASGPTAAALHGFDGFPLAPPWHLTTLRDRQVRRVGHFLHTTLVLPLEDRCTVRSLPAMSPARTIIDLARTQSKRRLSTAIDSAIRDGLTTEGRLHRRIVALRSQGRFGIPTLLEVLEGNEITRGGHSWLERRFLELLALNGLPRPVTQQILTKAQDRLVRVDCRFPGTNIVVELLGYRYHRGSRSQSSPRRRPSQRADPRRLRAVPIHVRPGRRRGAVRARHSAHRPSPARHLTRARGLRERRSPTVRTIARANTPNA